LLQLPRLACWQAALSTLAAAHPATPRRSSPLSRLLPSGP